MWEASREAVSDSSGKTFRNLLATFFVLAFTVGMGLSQQVSPQEGAAPRQTAETSLAAQKEVARPLLIFAHSSSDPSFRRQMEMLGVSPAIQRDGVNELAERGVVVIPILKVGTFTVDSAKSLFRALTAEESASARKRFGVKPSGFKVVLIGTDGTAKRLWQKPVASETIVDLIETMPGRKREKAKQERTGPH